MSTTKLYTVESNNRYYVNVDVIENVEDAGDDFVTAEEVRELLGLSETVYINTGIREKTSLITEVLTGYKNKLIAQNKRSMIIDDKELVEALTGGLGNYSVSDFCTGLRRVGNRLFLHEPTKKVPTARVVSVLINACQHTLNKGQGCLIDIKYVSHDKFRAITLAKKLLMWEEINFNGYYKFEGDEMDLAKQLWEDPSSLKKVEKQTVTA
jgi:hypothetical protein